MKILILHFSLALCYSLPLECRYPPEYFVTKYRLMDRVQM
jgi:hypothetical protein